MTTSSPAFLGYRKIAWSLIAMLMGGCVIPKSSWSNARDRAVCGVLVDCFGTYTDVPSCVDAVEQIMPHDCKDYRWGLAADCVRALQHTRDACPENSNDWRIPGVCSLVCQPTPDPTPQP